MEEFKKPSDLTAEKLGGELNKSKENLGENKKSADLIKPQNPYKIPQWSDIPGDGHNYSFEILKSGQIIDEVKDLEKKAYWSFGRLPENDIEMAHPTISRFHAILQYRPKSKTMLKVEENEVNIVENESPPEGWYIYDLDSTHGTFLNKQRIPPKVYIRIRVGHLLKLGASTRSYILQGPAEDEEPESSLSITELKAKRQHKTEEAALEEKRLADEAMRRASNESCSWGMSEDADEESDLAHNPYAITNNEELFLDDPKKTLRGYFEREDLELIYKCDEMSAGSFVCRVELPIDDANGRSVVAEVVHKGKKKDCVYQCALEACRILDRHGVLRQANQEPLKRKQKIHESDSDDDFWDRTGDVARKKERRATANTSVTFTYESLLKQVNDIDENIRQIELKLNEHQEQQQRAKSQKRNDGEDLDTFMERLHEEEMKFDKTEIRKLRIEEQRLKSEKLKLQKLIKIAKPVDISLNMQPKEIKSMTEESEISKRKQLPMIGKRNQFNKFKILKVKTTKDIKPLKLIKSDEEEVEEDEEHAVEKSQSCLNESSVENSDKIELNLNEKVPTAIQDDKYEENIQTLESSLEPKHSNNDMGNSNKKRRLRIRHRGKREEAGMNDEVEYEACEKYAKWLPPENQTGDGLTELNKKFGY